MEALRHLFSAQLLFSGRESWLREAFGLPTRAAYAFARAGEPAAAVVILERGRGLLLTNALGAERSRLESLANGAHSDDYHRYRAAVERCVELSRRARRAEERATGTVAPFE